MKQILLILFFITFSLNAKADYGYMRLSSLICEADYGVIGTIVKVDKSYFYLEVEKYVLGILAFDTVKILRFEDWNCGRRYNTYEIGQKELVFFRKSNYVIDDYDFLGYGAGGEFELPIRNDSIYYNNSYGRLQSYSLKYFLTALKDFDEIKQKTKETSQSISKIEQEHFAAKSELHRIFIECKARKTRTDLLVPTKGYFANLEMNYLYQDYENKVYAFDFDIDSIVLSVEDAEVWKEDNYFIVKPTGTWTRRWLKIYALNDKEKSNLLYEQFFKILELPEPRIYFGNSYSDSIYRWYEALPSVANYLDNLHQDEILKYELLSYTYIIKSGNSIEKFKIKSSRGNAELHERLKKIKPGDQITVSDVFVLYPNQAVRQIKGRTVTVVDKE